MFEEMGSRQISWLTLDMSHRVIGWLRFRRKPLTVQCKLSTMLCGEGFEGNENQTVWEQSVRKTDVFLPLELRKMSQCLWEHQNAKCRRFFFQSVF